MYMKNRYGVVIQGPLRSFGRSGRTANIPFSQVKAEDVLNFFSVPSIVSYFQRFGHLAKIICVVWDDEEDEDVEVLKGIVGLDNVKVIKDETRPVSASGGVIPGNNKYRQFYSTLKGLEFLKAEGVSHVIKVRSDQQIDVKGLIKDFEDVQRNRDKFILVPRFIRDNSDSLADFYFCAEVNLFESSLRDYLGSQELFSHVHTDLFYCWARKLVGEAPFKYYLSGSNLFDDYIVEAWNQGFCPASREVYSKIIWRGEKLVHIGGGDMFLEDIRLDFSFDVDQIIGRPSLLRFLVGKVKMKVYRLSAKLKFLILKR